MSKPPLSVSLPIGVALLLTSLASLTFVQQQATLRYVRVVLGVPTCYLLFQSLYPREAWAQVGDAFVTYFGLALLLLEVAVDTCFIRFFDRPQDVPKWIQTNRDEDGNIRRSTLPLPQTPIGRLQYAVDSLFSLRGGSWFKDRTWDWASPQIYAQDTKLDYGSFARRKLQSVLGGYIIFDMALAIVTARKWDLTKSDPLTSKPWIEQIFFGPMMGLATYSAIVMSWDGFMLLMVTICRSPPENWAPLWHDPQKANSLAEFWSKRWHTLFQRQWSRMTMPITALVQPYCSPLALQFIRSFLVFMMSGALHALQVHGLPANPRIRRPAIDFNVLIFFLAQPIGILLEYLFVKPLSTNLPERTKLWVRRAFMWSWLVWTARWFGNHWLLSGLFETARAPGLTLTLLRLLGISHPWLER